jgi:integrase/recombinase XerD
MSALGFFCRAAGNAALSSWAGRDVLFGAGAGPSEAASQSALSVPSHARLLIDGEEYVVERRGSVWADGPLGPFRDGVVEALSALGYSKDRAAQLVRLMTHLSRWLESRGLGPGDLSPEVAGEFFDGFHSRHSWCRSPRSLAPVLAYLRSVGAVPAAGGSRAGLGAGAVLVEDFCSYLRDQRGLSVATVEAYARYAAGCIRAWWPDGQIDVAQLDAGDVIWLVRAARDQRRPPSLRCMVTALRALLRFFHARGLTSRSLVEAVPAMATWPQTVLPSAVTSEAAARLVGSCDTSTAIGRRDAAILTLLARLGLRAGEVARLALDDIDWRGGEFRVAGKGGRVERLPLLADAGEAIAAYLADGRNPASRSRTVFLKVVAPFGPISADVVATVVYFACDRAGIPRFGPHRLRHMVASETLRAGAPLPEVAQLLRHSTVSTSTIYAIPDPASVAALARSWPVVRP